MNYIKTIKFSTLLLASLTFVACANKPHNIIQTEHDKYQLSDQLKLDPRQRADLYEAIIAADLSEQNNDLLSAMSYYLYAAEVTKNQKLIEKSLLMAQTIDDPLGIEQSINLWLSVSPDNLQAKTLLLEAQLDQQDMEDALKTASEILNQIKDSQNRYDLLENSVLNKDPRTSFSLLRELNNQAPTDVAIVTAQAKFIFNMANANKQSEQLMKQALQKVEEALTINPLFNPAIRIKTHLLFQSRRDTEAQSYLQNLFFENPKSSSINQMLGQLLYDLKDYHASVRHYVLWLEKHPEDLEARNYLAASYYALAEYRHSLKHFKLLVTKGYQPEIAAFYCGDSALKMEDFEQAFKCLSQVTSGRFLALSKIRLSKLLINKNQISEALTLLTDSRELNQKDQIRLKLAEVDLLNEHYSALEAKQALESAIENHPDNIALLLKKIELYQLTSQPDKLLELLHKAKSLFESGPKLDSFNLAVASLLKSNHYYQLAINWLNEAIKLKPDDKELIYTRALYKEPLGLYDEMIKDFKLLLAAYPDDLNIKNALGYTLADLGRELDYAEALIDNAYQGLPNNVAVIDSKGWLAFRLGQIATAEEHLRRAFKLLPSPEGAAHLGEVLWHKKEYESAKEIWSEGLKIEENNTILLKTLERLKVEL